MSSRVTAEVLERYPGKGGEFALAFVLADHAHADGSSIFPSVATLAQRSRQSVRTVQYQLQRMLASGWLQRVNEGDGGRGQTTEYRISEAWIKGADIAPISDDLAAVDNSQKGANTAPFPASKGCNPQHKRVQSEAQKGAKLLHPLLTGRTSIEPNTPQPPKGGECGFDAIWQQYPRHENEAAARRAWRRLNPDTACQERIQRAIAIASATEQWTKNNGAMVPHLSKWLRGQRWHDEVGADKPLPPDWWQSAAGVKAMGERLGRPYSLAPLGNAYTEDELSRHYRRYRDEVYAAAGVGAWTKDYAADATPGIGFAQRWALSPEQPQRMRKC